MNWGTPKIRGIATPVCGPVRDDVVYFGVPFLNDIWKYKGFNVGTGLPDGPPEMRSIFGTYTELPLRGRTVKDAGPYIQNRNIM